MKLFLLTFSLLVDAIIKSKIHQIYYNIKKRACKQFFEKFFGIFTKKIGRIILCLPFFGVCARFVGVACVRLDRIRRFFSCEQDIFF